MSQYRDVAQAVVRAFNCGEGKPKSASWQDQYTAGYRESRLQDCDSLDSQDRLTGDSMTFALIKRSVTDEQYHVLALKYSADAKVQIAAIVFLAALVGTNGGPNFRHWVIGRWALEKLRQKEPKVKNWDCQEVEERTLQDWQRGIRKNLVGWHDGAIERLNYVLADAGLITRKDTEYV